MNKELSSASTATTRTTFPLRITGDGFTGSIDTFSRKSVSGWIALQSRPNAKATVQLIINMVLRGEHIASEFRVDLKDAKVGEGDGHYGFQIDLTHYNEYFSNSLNSVELRIGEMNASLWNGSMYFPFDPYTYSPPNNEQSLRTLNIYTITFFDLEGNTYYSGGAERYLVDLVELCRNKGFDCKIIQASSGEKWRRYYRDIEVIGIPWNRSSILDLSRSFAEIAEPGSHAIFSPFILATAFCPQGSIGISHGIFWDLDGNCYSQGENHVLLHSSLKHLDHLVSVDAATLNFLRAAAPVDLSQTNAKVIINYVDGTGFDHAIEHGTSKQDGIISHVRKLKENGKTVFVYPRRLYAARGLDMLIETATHLLPQHEDMVVLFVGRGDLVDTQKVAKLAELYPSQVLHTWLEADDMPQAYDVADVVLVPTLHSEGTSLSCIEAMHCGKCVVVTHVGGLPELVIHQYNGLVIEPNSKSLLESIILLLKDSDLRSRLGFNARNVAKSLSKDMWTQSWKQFLDKCHPNIESDTKTYCSEPRVLFYHPPVPGIELNVMNQRPQALMSDLALMGAQTCFAQTSQTKNVKIALPRNMELISEKGEIFSDHAVILCYYPYTLIGYGEEFSKRLSGGDALAFQRLQQKYAHHITRQPNLYAKKISFWFDYLDHKDIHPDEDAKTLIELGIKYADILTTSSVLLAETITPERPDVVYLGNAVSMDWLQAVSGNSRRSSPNTISAVLSSDVMQDIAAWRRDGYKIGIYWGALADWNDVSFLDEHNHLVRYILVGPISDKKIRQQIRSSSICTHIEYMEPVGLAQLSRLAQFALIPFKSNSVTEHVNPLKLWEYLALGLPVIARSTGELKAQVVRMSQSERRQVHLVDEDMSFGNAIRFLLEGDRLERLALPPRIFAFDSGPLLKQVNKAGAHKQRLLMSEHDLAVWFVPASVQTPGVQASNVDSKLILEMPADLDVRLAPRWDLVPATEAILKRCNLRLRLNKDIALLKDVILEVFGKNGKQYELLGNARPATNGLVLIDLENISSVFEKICIQLQLPLQIPNQHGKRRVVLDWEYVEVEFTV